jgi:hypothetical protein
MHIHSHNLRFQELRKQSEQVEMMKKKRADGQSSHSEMKLPDLSPMLLTT